MGYVVVLSYGLTMQPKLTMNLKSSLLLLENAAHQAIIWVLELQRLQWRHPINLTSPDWDTSQESGEAMQTQPLVLAHSPSDFSDSFLPLLKSSLIESYCDRFCGFLPGTHFAIWNKNGVGKFITDLFWQGGVSARFLLGSPAERSQSYDGAGRKQCFVSFGKNISENEMCGPHTWLSITLQFQSSCFIFNFKITLLETKHGGAHLYFQHFKCRGKGMSVSLRQAWSTSWVPDQPELHKWDASQN